MTPLQLHAQQCNTVKVQECLFQHLSSFHNVTSKNDDSGNGSILRVMAGVVMTLVMPAGGDYDEDVNDGDDDDGDEEGCSC